MKYTTLNPVAKIGLDGFGDKYERCDDINNADIVLVRSADMNTMDIPKNVIAIARAGIGVNNIPIEKCAKDGIVVFNTPGANANGVKELVIASLLLASRDIIGGVEWVRSEANNPDIEKLAEKKKKAFAGTEIKGKKLGVIGLGAVGQLVANAAVDLDMDVYGYDPYLSVDAAWNLSRSVHHVNDVNDIYKKCDFISIHVPLMDATRGMIGKKEIELMRNGVVVINLARDRIVDEPFMVEALKAGKVKKYVTDFANETITKAPNTIIIPHLGASTKEAEDNCAVMAVKEVVDYIENGNIKNSVNYPNCNLGVCVDAGRIAICHKNVPNMISTFTKEIGNVGINIENLTNKARGDFAYTLIDIAEPASKEIIDRLIATDGVTRVRVVK